jgi:ribosomal protein S18 acetylase RimI-like enzyme
MDVLIRTAAPADLAAVGTLTVDVYGGEQLVSTGYLPVLADAAARAAAPLTEVVVATRAPSSAGMSSEPGEIGERIGAPGAPGERILGALTLCRFGSPFADLAEEGEAEIRMLAVRFEARQRGVGEALVLDSAERARAHGCTRLVLSTMPVMESAQRLYERTGFQRIAHRDLTLRQGFRLLAYALEL